MGVCQVGVIFGGFSQCFQVSFKGFPMFFLLFLQKFGDFLSSSCGSPEFFFFFGGVVQLLMILDLFLGHTKGPWVVFLICFFLGLSKS